MERTVFITVKSIAESWGHPDLQRHRKASARKQLCKALLPDAYDDQKCSEAAALFFREGSGDDTTALNESTLRMLVCGNRHRKLPRIHSGSHMEQGSALGSVDIAHSSVPHLRPL